MGGGRGSLSHFVAQVEVGRIIVEIDGVAPEMAREALRLGGHKLPIRTTIVTR